MVVYFDLSKDVASPITNEQRKDCFNHFQWEFLTKLDPKFLSDLHQSREFEWDESQARQAGDLVNLAIDFLGRAMETKPTLSVDDYKAAWSIDVFKEEKPFRRG